MSLVYLSPSRRLRIERACDGVSVYVEDMCGCVHPDMEEFRSSYLRGGSCAFCGGREWAVNPDAGLSLHVDKIDALAAALHAQKEI